MNRTKPMSMNIINIQDNNTPVMTLKEITDLIDVRHDKAMTKVEKLAEEDGFGTLSKMDIVYNSKGQTIQTYTLTKKQSIAAAARLNNAMLMNVINRLEELEINKQMLTYEQVMQQALMLADKKVKEQEEKISSLYGANNLLMNKNEKLYSDLEESIEEIQARDTALEHITDRSKSISIDEWAKLMFDLEGFVIGGKRLFRLLREEGYIARDNTPYQKYREQRLFEVKANTYTNRTTGEDVFYTQTRVTPKGIEKLSPIISDTRRRNENKSQTV